MAKRDDERTPAEDYLAQIEWQSRRPPPYRGRELRPWWASNEPKWKYKKVDGRQLPSSGAMRLIVFGSLLLIGYIIFQGFLKGSDEAIYIGGAALVATLILFFAIRDASKPNRPTDD